MNINKRLKQIAKELRKDPKNKELKEMFLELHREQFLEMHKSGELDVIPRINRNVRYNEYEYRRYNYYV